MPASLKQESAVDASGGRRGCWLASVGGRRKMVVVEVIVVEAHCYICCTFGVIVTDGAMYTGV